MYAGYFVFIFLVVPETRGENCTWTWFCAPDVAKRTIQDLMLRNAAIVHDEENGHIVRELPKVQLMVYEINNETIIKDMLHEIHEKFFPDVNVVVALQVARLLTKVLLEADDFDIYSNHSTDWSHHSKWIVFSSALSVVHITGLKLKNLQNIAVLTYEPTKCVCKVDTLSLNRVDEGYRFLWANNTELSPQKMFPNTQYRYNGRSLRVSAVESYPFIIAKQTTNKDEFPYIGHAVDVLHSIADHLNLTIQFVEAKNGIWGWTNDGMIGQLRRKEIDLIAGDITVHASRAKYVDFIEPYLQTDKMIIFYKMPPATEPILLLAGPFQTSVYLTCLAVTLAVTAMLIVIEMCDKLSFNHGKKKAMCLFFRVIKSSLKQGDAFEKISIPGRVLVVFWWLLVMLISSLYCGNLTATLAISSPVREFKNRDDLVDSDFHIGVTGGSSMEQTLKNSTLRTLYDKIERINKTNPRVTSSVIEHHVQQVKEGKYAFFIHSSNVDRLVKNNCSLAKMVMDDMPQESTTFAIQKNSPFKSDIDKAMQKLHSRGLLINMWEKWTSNAEPSVCEKGLKSITITELIGGVIVASAGCGLASMLLFLEWLFYRFRRK